MLTEKPTPTTGIRVIVALLGVAGALLVTAMVMTGQQGVSIFLAMFASERLGMPASSISGVYTIVGIASLIFTPIFGLLSDLGGRRKFIAIGFVIITAAIFMHLLISSQAMLIVTRLILAIGMAAFAPALMAYLLGTTRSRWMYATLAGLYFCTTSIVSLTAPAAAGQLYEQNSSLLYITFGLVALIGGMIGMALIGGGYLLERGYAWGNAPQFSHSLWQRVLFVILALAAGLLIIAAGQAFSSFASVYFYENLGRSALYLGLFFTALSGAYAVAAIVGGGLADFFDWLSQRVMRRAIGRAILFMFGALLMAAAIVMLIAIPEKQQAILMVIAMLFGFGQGLTASTLYALLADEVHPRWWATVFGGYIGLIGLQNLGLMWTMGQIADSFGLTTVFVTAAAFLIVGLVILAAFTVLRLVFKPAKLEGSSASSMGSGVSLGG